MKANWLKDTDYWVAKMEQLAELKENHKFAVRLPFHSSPIWDWNRPSEPRSGITCLTHVMMEHMQIYHNVGKPIPVKRGKRTRPLLHAYIPCRVTTKDWEKQRGW